MDFLIGGVVTDSNVGKPVFSATVRVWTGGRRRCSRAAEFSTSTDRTGQFALHVPKPGPYFVCAGAIGYSCHGQILRVPNDSSTSLSLRLPQNPLWVGP